MIAANTNPLSYADLPLRLGIVFEKDANRASFVFPRTRWQLIGQVLIAMLGAHILVCTLAGIGGLATVLIFSDKATVSLERYITFADWVLMLGFAIIAIRSNRQYIIELNESALKLKSVCSPMFDFNRRVSLTIPRTQITDIHYIAHANAIFISRTSGESIDIRPHNDHRVLEWVARELKAALELSIALVRAD